MATPAESQDKNKVPPSPSLLKKLEGMSVDALCKVLGIPEKPKNLDAYRMTAEQEEQLRDIEAKAIQRFKGDLTQLESALGMLRMGHRVGWKVLYIIHTKQTIRNYEEILGMRIREIFDETGPGSERSIGFNVARRFSNFWKVAGGDIKIPRRRDAG